jgi:hypothetical protein
VKPKRVYSQDKVLLGLNLKVTLSPCERH